MKFSILSKIFIMDEIKLNQPIDTSNLPQSEVFIKKEVYQHKQPPDRGNPIDPIEEDKKLRDSDHIKEADRASKEEGLNEQNAEGEPPAFDD